MKRNNRGAALMVALAVLAGLVALVGVLASSHGNSMQAETTRTDMRRAEFMAQSGIQRAIAEIQLQTKGPTTLNDSWATLGAHGGTSFDVGNDAFRIQIIDLASRVNVNVAGHDTLAKLPISSDQVDCLLDWREKTPTARPTGAKDDYYNSLSKPYNTKLQTLGSVDELLQVKGFTPSTLFSGATPPLNDLVTVDSASADLDPNGKPKTNIAAATSSQLTSVGIPPQLANTLVQSENSFTKLQNVLVVQGMDQASAKAILNYFQIGGTPQISGLINVNTASEAVLESIPGIEPDVAQSIINLQGSGMKGLGDLVDVPGLSLQDLAKFVDQLATTSKVFEVRSLGVAAGITVALDAILAVDSSGNVTVTRLQSAPSKNPVLLWGWPNNVTDRTTLAGAW